MTQYNRSPAEPKAGEGRRQPFLNTPSGFALCVFAAVVGVFLWVEHRAHVLAALPLLLPLLICVGMHFFMHRGHGGHKGGGDERLLAALNAGIFILFAFSFFKPTTARDWRKPGAFSALVASNLPYQQGVQDMRTRNFPTALFAGLLLLGTVTSVAAQTDAQEQDAHHPAKTQATPPAPPTPGDSPAAAAPGSMPGMGMMTPEMMQMMQRMMGQGGMPGMMGGMAGQGMPGGDAGPGMTSHGQMPMAGMMMCPMMQMMTSGQAGMGMPGIMGGQGILFGSLPGAPEEMTEDRVRALLEQQLTSLGNPRLKLGEIGAAADGGITAEIVTVDGSLVQKLAFNRYPGLVRKIVE